MDEQTSPPPEPTITTSEPVATDSPAVVEPPQAEPAPVAETAQTVTTEPTADIPQEPSTAQMGRDEPLPESVSEPVPQGAKAQAEAPKQETPIVIPPPSQPQNIGRIILDKARAVIQSRKQKKLEKIMGLFATKQSITNDEVEKLLHVSDATATRYLSHLEKDGKIVQSGKTGHAVSYTKI